MRPERRALFGGWASFRPCHRCRSALVGRCRRSSAAEISLARGTGLKVGLAILYRYALEEEETYRAQIRDELRREIDGETVQMIGYGEEVSCDLLLLRDPRILQDRQRYVPRISAGAIGVIVDRPPLDGTGTRVWEPATCEENLRQYFGSGATWHPTNQLVRSALAAESMSLT